MCKRSFGFRLSSERVVTVYKQIFSPCKGRRIRMPPSVAIPTTGTSKLPIVSAIPLATTRTETQAHAALMAHARQRLRDTSSIRKRYAAELSNIANGLTIEDGLTHDDLSRFPMTDLATILNQGNTDVIARALNAFELQIRRILMWRTSINSDIIQQGQRGFNATATRILLDGQVDGVRTCDHVTEGDGDGRPLLLHQAVVRTLLHPLTPVRRMLAIHPTGTGKSLVMIHCLESYFHDPRPKVIIVPSFIVELQIVQDMLTLLPSGSNLRRWYESWRRENPNIDPTQEAWHIIAALSFRKLDDARRENATAASTRPTGEDADDEDAFDTEDDTMMQIPVMRPDRSRMGTLERMQRGDRPIHEIPGATHELRAPITFITYAEHKLGMYRENPVFAQHRGEEPSVSYSNKIVLVDEMHNLFDEGNPNLNSVQRRKLFGDRELRQRSEERLRAATNDTERRRAAESVLIYTGLSRLLRTCQKSTLVGLTATPIVAHQTDGAKSALRILDWIRGRKTTASTMKLPTGFQWKASPEDGRASHTEFEGYVSYFGVKPTSLFAIADEVTYPAPMPIVKTVPPSAIEMQHDELTGRTIAPTYGMGRLASLQRKYDVARRASEWFERMSDGGWYVPPAAQRAVSIDYWDRSRAWTAFVPRLAVTQERMPEWAEGLYPYGRTIPRMHQSTWFRNDDRVHAAWIAGSVVYNEQLPVQIDDDGTNSTAHVLGRHGRVDVLMAHETKRRTIDAIVAQTHVRVDTTTVTFAPSQWTMRTHDASGLPGHASKIVLTVDPATHDVKRVRTVRVNGDVAPQYIVIERLAHEDVVVPNSETYTTKRGVRLSALEYDAEAWFYEQDQLNVTYAGRLDRFINDEGNRWMNVFYGGREVRAAQGRAALGESQEPCVQLGGVADTDRALIGFAVDLARHVVPVAMNVWSGKVLWLLSEQHGLALVERWMECEEAREWRNSGRVAIFGAYRNEDRVRVQRGARRFLDDVFNSSDNVNGERCKLLIGGAADLGVGVTFTEVRHIVLDLAPSYFNVLQQMGRGARLCKHARLPPSQRTLDFHLPFPVLTTGWGGVETDATRRNVPGGIGNVQVTMEEFVQRLKVDPRRQSLQLPLHVPVHTFDTLTDLQKSRIRFLDGMQTFAAVAMDREYYRQTAGWTIPLVDLATEPKSAPQIEQFVRARVRQAVESIPETLEAGRDRLRQESEENGRYNAAVLARDASDAIAGHTRQTASEQTFRDEVFKRNEVAKRRVERTEKAKVKKQATTAANTSLDELRAEANCRNYGVAPDGTFFRTDKPNGFVVDQSRIRKLIETGSRVGDPVCLSLLMESQLRISN